MTGNFPPLVILLGPTAVGKTSLAIEMAKSLNGEIIGADSRQIYRYMDIGTAKPDREQQGTIPHHLIDVVNPDETLSLAQYQDLTLQAIEAITKRGNIPFLVGGTGQYLTAIEEGWSIPRVAPNYALREQLEAQATQIGAQAFHKLLIDVDPDYAQKTHPNNIRRVVRALEVYLETGETMTTLQRKQPLPYRIYTLGLKLERQHLYFRADNRVDQMMQAGFLAEVVDLLDRGYHRNLPSMTALGYRELCMHLLDDMPLDQAIFQAKNNTHDFIRKQEIWFRGHDNGIMWHNVEDLDTNTLIKQVERWIQE